VGANWAAVKGGEAIHPGHGASATASTIVRSQEAEKNDPGVQQLISRFMELVDLPEQQVQGSFTMGYYSRIAGGPKCRVGQRR